MKRITSFILVFILCFVLLGCSSMPSPTGDTAGPDGSGVLPESNGVIADSDGQNNAAPDLLPEESANGQIIIKIDNSDIDYYYAPDGSGKLILSYICEKPVVEIENNDYATDIVNAFFNDLDEEYYTGENRGPGIGSVFSPGFNQMLQMAYDNYQCYLDYDADLTLELVFSHYVDIVRCDNSVISFVFTDYLFDGSGNGEYYKYALSFDSFSGQILDFTENREFSRIRRIVNKTVTDYSELSYEPGFCFLDGTGMSFLVRDDAVVGESHYRTVTVPYSAFDELNLDLLTGTGKNKNGNVIITDSPNEYGEIPILDRIDQDPDGEQFFLTVLGTVYDFKLINVQYSNYDEVFYSKNVYWMTNYITDARLQLSLDIPDGMPDMMLSYTSEGVEYSRFITQSGNDGQVILIDTDISAVG